MGKHEEQVIWDRIVNPENYEESADALIELKYTHRHLAEKFALEILQKPDEEPYYQATAFDIFYSINQSAGLEMIRIRLDEVNLIMLRSMIGCVTEDSALLDGDESLLATVKAIDKRIATLEAYELESIKDTIDWFKETFEKVLF